MRPKNTPGPAVGDHGYDELAKGARGQATVETSEMQGVGNHTTPGQKTSPDPHGELLRGRQGLQLTRGAPAYDPDSAYGLAKYFHWKVSDKRWADRYDTNLKALASYFAKLKREENFTPETIRAMIDRYATDSRLHTDQVVIPWKDFLSRRALLVNGARQRQLGQDYRARHQQALAEDVEVEIEWDNFPSLKSA